MLAIDLYSGGGGVCLGLQWAAFEVVGIDIQPRPTYPGTFIQADVRDLPVLLEKADLVWASPPCQAFSVATAMSGKPMDTYPDLIPETRELLKGRGLNRYWSNTNERIRMDRVVV